MDEGFYNTANADERRRFLGIDVDDLRNQEFSLKNRDEVVRFAELIKSYVENETHLPFHWIDLPRWFDKCMTMDENGARLFTAFLDLKITLAFVFIDFYRITPGFTELNKKESTNILTNAGIFKEKIDLLHNNIDMAIRFRAFYDKLMGVLVLFFCPDKYDSKKKNSRKEDFKTKMKDYIDPESLDSLYATILKLDNNFRTAEVHYAGRMRKWVLGGRDCFADKAVELGGFFNSILGLSDWLDKLIDEDLYSPSV